MDVFTFAQWRAQGHSRRALTRDLECRLVWRVLNGARAGPVGWAGRLPLDLGWLRYHVGAEYDGEEWHDEDSQRQRDERRRETMRREGGWKIEVARKGDLWGQRAALVASTARRLRAAGWSPSDPTILEQIARAAEYEAQTGQRWQWMPLQTGRVG